MVGSQHCAIRGVRALANNSDSAIGLNLGGNHEVVRRSFNLAEPTPRG